MITEPNIKINLGLNILRKREDGFHDLETLFYPDFSYSDTLEIVQKGDNEQTSKRLQSLYTTDNIKTGVLLNGKLHITIAGGQGIDWDVEKDITTKAYLLLNQDFNLPETKIFLEKKSPIGAGLGGGSADGAFALKMLNEIYKLNLSMEKLIGYAAKLGSDCCFFLYNRPMLGKEKGNILSPFHIDLDDYDIKIVIPENIHISTAQAYSNIIPSENHPSIENILHSPINEWKGKLINMFEPSVFQKYPVLAQIKDSLYESGAIYASLSGSGSALFGIYPK